jgi:hypothetical protein
VIILGIFEIVEQVILAYPDLGQLFAFHKPLCGLLSVN